MFKGPGSVRLWLTGGILVCAFALLQTMSHGEPVVAREPLRALPYALGGWSAVDEPIQQEVLKVVGVTDYSNRLYSRGAEAPVQLYVGYYASQRSGDTIHSPKNCLPGAGWDPIRAGYATVTLSNGRKIVVNEYLIQQDKNKQLVFYWYQGRGRVIASEYRAKFWMIADALSRNRTDGALLRLVTPMSDGEAEARARLMSFTQILFPYLEKVIPQ
jgi:EpsI family protein